MRANAWRNESRSTEPLDLRRLPEPETMARAIAALQSHQSGNQIYEVMTAVACPSCVGALRFFGQRGSEELLTLVAVPGVMPVRPPSTVSTAPVT